MCLNRSIETATTARRKAVSSRISGRISTRPIPEISFPVACVPGRSIGTETGKKRKESNSVFPSEYITRADTIEPTTARSITPMTNGTRIGKKVDASMFRKKKDDVRVARRTSNRITHP